MNDRVSVTPGPRTPRGPQPRDETMTENQIPDCESLLIVSRHPATIEFIQERAHLGGVIVLESATAEDVRGRIIYGNLPLHLAALAAEVVAVEFTGPPPRGREYSLADMEAAGAKLRRYRVTDVTDDELDTGAGA